MKQPANSCGVRKGCVVFGTESRGEEEEEERGEEIERRGGKLKSKRRAERRGE